MLLLYLCASLVMGTAECYLIHERECTPVAVEDLFTLILDCPFKGSGFYILPTPTSLSKLKTIIFEHLDSNSGIIIDQQGVKLVIENGDIA